MGEKLPANAADNWDLQAVVSCFSTAAYDSTKNYAPQQTNTTVAAVENSADPLAFLANMEFDKEDDPFSFPLLLESNHNGFDELQDSYSPFFPPPPSSLQQLNTSTVSPMNSSFPPLVFGEQNNQHTQQTHRLHHALQQRPLISQQHQQQQQQPQPLMMSSLSPLRPMLPLQAPRCKKRKTPIKKVVCQVKLEHLSNDPWAWRKYGQKPIKGSPYPRNYYRCSSSKGCGARKQMERSNTDPGIYIVSYTGDHTHPRPTHRNSLAGSTRNKFSRTQIPVTTTIANNSSTSPLSATCQPPTSPPAPAVEEMNNNNNTIQNSHTEEADNKDKYNKGFMEEEEVDHDLFKYLLIPNLAAPAIDEDFFKGLEQFSTTAASGSGSSDG